MTDETPDKLTDFDKEIAALRAKNDALISDAEQAVNNAEDALNRIEDEAAQEAAKKPEN